MIYSSMIFMAVFMALFLGITSQQKSVSQVEISKTVLVGERIARVGFAEAENEPQVQYFDVSSESLSPFNEEGDILTNPGSTPNHWSSGSTPNHWSSTSTPNHWSTTSTPNHWSTTSTPNHWSTTSTPNHWSSGSTPNHWSSASTPNHWSSTSTPNHWSTGNQPSEPNQINPQEAYDGNEEWLLSGRYAIPSPKVRLMKIAQ